MVIHHRFLHIRVVWISAGPPSTWKCIQIRVMMCGGVKQMWDPWPFWSFSFALVWFVFFYLFYWVFILQLDGYSFIDWACLETPTQSFSENPFKRVWNLLFLQFSQLLFFWSKWSKLWQTDICRKAKKKIFLKSFEAARWIKHGGWTEMWSAACVFHPSAFLSTQPCSSRILGNLKSPSY